VKKIIAILAFALLPLIAGCPSVPQLPDSKTLPPAANLALKAIASANAALDVAYDFIDSGVRSGAIEPKQGRAWFNMLDEYKAKVADAQKLYDSGGFDAAKAQAAGTEALIKFLHDQAIKSLQDQARKSATFYPDRDLPILRSIAWIRQPQHSS
jgi:hypothetical protein